MRFFAIVSSFSDIVIEHLYQDLTDEQEKKVNEILARQMQVYLKIVKWVSRMIEHMQETYNLAFKSVDVG